MILVTVGTHDQQFNRLVKTADRMAELIDEKIVIQRGCSDFIPQQAEFFDWTSMNEMEGWIVKSRVVIAHAGAGTIITVIKYGKPLVLAPRLKAYREHLNDHQLELASALDREGRAIMVVDISIKSLINAINLATIKHYTSGQPAHLIHQLRQQLSKWQRFNKPI